MAGIDVLSYLRKVASLTMRAPPWKSTLEPGLHPVSSGFSAGTGGELLTSSARP